MTCCDLYFSPEDKAQELCLCEVEPSGFPFITGNQGHLRGPTLNRKNAIGALWILLYGCGEPKPLGWRGPHCQKNNDHTLKTNRWLQGYGFWQMFIRLQRANSALPAAPPDRSILSALCGRPGRQSQKISWWINKTKINRQSYYCQRHNRTWTTETLTHRKEK